jgi:hypothetical protein
MREGTASRVMVADRPYGEFYDFYVSLEYFGYTLILCSLTGVSEVPAVSIFRIEDFCVVSYDHSLIILYFVTELPALSQSEDLDVSWYNSSFLPFATAARLAHKKQLQSLNTPVWWKL